MMNVSKKSLSVLAVVAGLASFSTVSMSRAEKPGLLPTSPIPKDFPMKPDVTVPEGAPPTTLVIDDITVGNGAEAVVGKSVTVQYVGVAWSTGKQFDASWDRGQPFSFPLGGGRVIQGWDKGVAGMKIGGRRKLTIPPELGYGSRGAGGAIKPNETLIFVVDLLEVK